MCLVLMLHGLAMVQAGAVRGLGMLELATWMVLFAFYFVALPLAYLFAFPVGMSMVGLWWGVVGGSIAEIVLYVVILRFKCDWKRIAIEISENLKIKEVSPNNSAMLGGGDPTPKGWGSNPLKEPLIAATIVD